MLASRLVKSCLFMFVALAPVVAKASFVIDNFGAASSVGANVTRNVALSNASFTPDIGGFTNVSFTTLLGGTATITYAPVSGNFGTASNNPALSRLFLDVAVPNTGANVTVQVGATTLFSGAITSAQTLVLNSASLASANSLTISLGGPNGAVFRLNELTATPEPTTMLMFGSVAGIGLLARRRFKSKK